MADEKKQIYELEIKGLDDQLKKLSELNSLIEQQRAEIKQLKDTDKTLAEERKVQLKQTQDQYRQLSKEVKAEKDAVEAGTKTLAQKRAELARLNKELENTEIGSENFKKLQVESKKLRSEINGADEAVGKFQGNVGNYKNAVIDAFQQMGINVRGLSGLLGDNQSAIQTSTGAAKGLGATFSAVGKAMIGTIRAVGAALLANPIGAIIAALAAVGLILFNLFKSFDPVVDRLQQGLAALGAVFSSLKDTVLSVITGQKSLSEAVSDAGEAMSRSAKFAIEYKKAQQELDDMIWKSIVTQQEYKNQIDELLLQARNRTLDETKRIELIEEALRIERVAFEERKANAEKEKEIAELEIIRKNNLTDAEIENLKKLGVEYAIALKDRKSVTDQQVKNLADAIAKSLQVENESIQLREKAQNRRDQIEDQRAEKQKKAAELAIQNRTKLEAELKKQDEARLKAIQEQQKQELENEEFNYTQKLFLLQKSLALNKITQEEYDTSVTELERERLNVLLALYTEFDLNTRNLLLEQADFEISELFRKKEEEQRILLERDQQIKNFYNSLKSYQEQQFEAEQALSFAKLNLYSSLTDGVQGLVKEETAVGKILFLFQRALAIADVIRSAAAAKTKILANLFSVPPILPPGIPNPAYAVASALAAAQLTALKINQVSSIASIVAQAVPKFASGVIGLQGTGTETSDSISARLSKGESVMTARATKVFAPILADMERAVGNQPNYNASSRRFATGLIGSPRTDFAQPTERIIRETIEAVSRIPVVVAEGDITATQKKVRRINVSGDL